MKKIIILFLSVVISLTLCACGTKTTEQHVEEILSGKVGDRVTFGTYYGEEIEWTVVRCIKNRAMLVTSDIIDMQLYHNTAEEVTWENCDLRKWLNEYFYNEAFSEEEKLFIASKEIENPDSIRYKTSGGNPTLDCVTILSINEATNYSQNKRFEEIWWLRSPVSKVDLTFSGKTYTYYYGAVIDRNGEVKESIAAADMKAQIKCGVRPVIWLEMQ